MTSSGAISGLTDHRHISDGGSCQGSSSGPPSYEMCSMLASIEKGDFVPRFISTGMPCFSA